MGGGRPNPGRPLRGQPLAPAPAPSPARRQGPATPQRPPARPLARPANAKRGIRHWLGSPLNPIVLRLALLSLAITLLRLAGELLGWSPRYWNRAPGGPSPLGIAWLIPLVGFYLGWRLRKAGVRPTSLPQAALQPALALVVVFSVLPLVARMRTAQHMPTLAWPTWLSLWALAAVLVIVTASLAWPAIGRPLLAYAFLARAPVAAAMALAMWRRWPTHYGTSPPGFPTMPWLERWLWTGLLLQFTVWIAITMAVGVSCGVLGWLAADGLARLRSR